jgi:excisionase family DNA binding protein
MSNDKTYTVREIADYLRVSEKTLRKYITDGELQAYKLDRQWRITKEQLDTFLDTKK